MCGRARCTLHREEIARMAGVPSEAFVDGDKYRPCENMGPGRYGPVTFRAREAGQSAGERRDSPKHAKLQAMRWGLIPSFTKPHAKPDHFIMFNARSESLHERPAFRRLLETKRCVILSEGYYEWHQVDKKEKQPYYIYRTSGPLKFAGLYDSWVNDEGETSYTYTILTTEISPQLAWMHTRIPVILTDEGASRWMSDAKFDSLRDLLVGYTGDDLVWHPVDKRVGSTKFQSEDCTKKVDIKHAASITSFFGATASADRQEKIEGKAVLDVLDSTPMAKPDPASASQTESTKTSQSDSTIGSQDTKGEDNEESTPKPAPAAPPRLPPTASTLSPARVKPERREEFRSPIKFLFQQQHMVQQAEEIMAASKGLPTSTSAAASDGTQANPVTVMGTKRTLSPNHPRPSPKKTKRSSPSPKKPATKPAQRGTLLAYFQPKS